MTIATLLAGVLVAGLLLPYSLGLGLASNKVTNALAATNEDVLDGVIPERSTIEDDAGNVITYVYDQNRQIVPSEDIALALKEAIVAVEDKRFYAHKGVDWRGTTRALLSNASSTGGQQGGSTLTQQYVKNYLFLVQAKTDTEKAAAIATTPGRKLREAKLALTLEQKETKDQILTGYLNLVAFLPNVYGAEATARSLFGVTAAQLTLPQAAMMAGMVNNPNRYDPLDPASAKDSVDRRNAVLKLMRDQGYINTAQMTTAQSDIPKFASGTISTGCVPPKNRTSDARSKSGYFCQYALDYLANAGLSASAIADGGYTIKTTLNKDAMNNAWASVTENVDPKQYPDIANVLAVVQPTSSRKVLALVANQPYGLDTTKGQTVQKLTTTFAPLGAGSTFKIFTAAAALVGGLGTTTEIANPDPYTSEIGSHAFHNDTDGNEKFPAKLSIADALATSPNTAFVKLEDQLGLGTVVNMAVAMGMKGYLLPAGDVDPAFTGTTDTYDKTLVANKVASFTLGVTPVSPLELANVGATISNDGTWCPPNPIDIVTDRNGSVVTVKRPGACGAVFSKDPLTNSGIANALANAMGEDVDNDGSTPELTPIGSANQAAKAAGWDMSVGTSAGKTGTTGDYKSSAFLGFTPNYSAAALTWDYTPKPQSICINPPYVKTDPLKLTVKGTCTSAQSQSSEGNTTATITGMTGGSVPAASWFQAMLKIQPDARLFPSAGGDAVIGAARTLVPDVTTCKNQVDAGIVLRNNGFTDIQTKDPIQNSSAANTVTRQDPVGGSHALQGTDVIVYFSAGPGGTVGSATSPTTAPTPISSSAKSCVY